MGREIHPHTFIIRTRSRRYLNGLAHYLKFWPGYYTLSGEDRQRVWELRERALRIHGLLRQIAQATRHETDRGSIDYAYAFKLSKYYELAECLRVYQGLHRNNAESVELLAAQMRFLQFMQNLQWCIQCELYPASYYRSTALD